MLTSLVFTSHCFLVNRFIIYIYIYLFINCAYPLAPKAQEHLKSILDM